MRHDEALVAVAPDQVSVAVNPGREEPAPPPTVYLVPTPTATPTPLPTSLPTAIEAVTTPAVALLGNTVDRVGLSPLLSAPEADLAPAVGLAPPSGRIAYSVWNPRTDRLDVVIYSLATGIHWPVIANKRQPDFNNQSDLAVNGEGGHVDNLALLRPTGEQLAIISAHAEDAHPHWSPANKTIVFDSALVGDGRYRLYLQQDTGYGRPVSPLMYDAWEIFGRYPIFLRDNRIAYNGCDVWENGSNCGIYVVDVAGGRPSAVTNWPDDIPTDNADSDILMMSDRDGDWEVYWANPLTREVRQLTSDPGRDGLATASPDGRYIAFVTDREGAWSVYVIRIDGGLPYKLFDLDPGYGRDDRNWRQERISWGF